MRKAKALEQEYRNRERTPAAILERASFVPIKLMKINKGKIDNTFKSLDNDTGESETDVSKRKYNEDNVSCDTFRSRKRKNKKKYEIISEVQHEQQQQQQQQQQQEEQQQLQQQSEEHRFSYVHCPFFKNELFPGLDEFDTYDQDHTQPVQIIPMDSPNSNIGLCNIKYPQLLDSSTSLEIPNIVDLNERVNDISLEDIHTLNHIRTFQGCKSIEEEYNTIMEHTPDFVLKIFNNLRPVMGFEKNYDEVNSLELPSIDNEHLLNDEIKMSHLKLANCITIQESQFDVLARNLENPVLQSQRKNLTQLQAEHKMQKQMLKTLQQEHLNVQVNTKQNVGV
ncbi:putative mediator of RNA polymerase II transcription subunit 10 [Polistes fuscatus]|uniref:putative mediator of RNA polymerase II transcription subunit 10 n=1 Tax=Polistes fuscatus TaxID=30207 RepID=UPI001CA848C7|nr:putative mediator of RNA polymerase II transcription subunit 10 [Polistes fuscatus]